MEIVPCIEGYCPMYRWELFPVPVEIIPWKQTLAYKGQCTAMNTRNFILPSLSYTSILPCNDKIP